MSKILVKFNLYCGRMGDLHGLFVCTKSALEGLYGQEIYFGEVLGKHSEIVATMESSMFEIASDDEVFIVKLLEVVGSKSTISGFNPFDYVEEE